MNYFGASPQSLPRVLDHSTRLVNHFALPAGLTIIPGDRHSIPHTPCATPRSSSTASAVYSNKVTASHSNIFATTPSSSGNASSVYGSVRQVILRVFVAPSVHSSCPEEHLRYGHLPTASLHGGIQRPRQVPSSRPNGLSSRPESPRHASSVIATYPTLLLVCCDPFPRALLSAPRILPSRPPLLLSGLSRLRHS